MEQTFSLVHEWTDLANQGVSIVNWITSTATSVLESFQSSAFSRLSDVLPANIPAALSVVITVYFMASFVDYIRGR